MKLTLNEKNDNLNRMADAVTDYNAPGTRLATETSLLKSVDKINERDKAIEKELNKRAKGITLPEPGVGKKITLKPYTEGMRRKFFESSNSGVVDSILSSNEYLDYFECRDPENNVIEDFKYEIGYKGSPNKFMDDVFPENNARLSTLRIKFDRYSIEMFKDFLRRSGYPDIAERIDAVYKFLEEEGSSDSARLYDKDFDITGGFSGDYELLLNYATDEEHWKIVADWAGLSNNAEESLPPELKNYPSLATFYNSLDDNKKQDFVDAALYLMSRDKTGKVPNGKTILAYVNNQYYMSQVKRWKEMNRRIHTESYQGDMMREFAGRLSNEQAANLYRRLADALDHAEEDSNPERREFYRELVNQAQLIAYRYDDDPDTPKMIDDDVPQGLIDDTNDLFDNARDVIPESYRIPRRSRR